MQEIVEVFETPQPYSAKRLDSLSVQQFLKEHSDFLSLADRIKGFYARREMQYAWFVSDTLSESANSFLALVNSDDTLHTIVSGLREGVEEPVERRSRDIAEVELLLTANFYRFAQDEYEGLVQTDLNALDWYIPRRKKDADRLLDSLLKSGMDLSMLEPVHPQYKALKKHSKLYHALEAEAWEPIVLPKKVRKITPGQRSASIPSIRERLVKLGDHAAIDSVPDADLYDSTLVNAMKEFQARHGLIDDGVIGDGVLAAMNVHPRERLKTLLMNMERLRWMPERTDEDLILVNIPEFKLHVLEDGKETMNMEVVVGNEATRTVIFSDTISYIVFSPAWTLPKSIIKNEILPELEKDPDYLESKDMEIIGGTEELPLIRQRPGEQNALGRVKFMFPNSYNIYLHDTPAKSLFNREERAFSHGCIRVSRPLDLAKYLLRKEDAWTEDSIKASMDLPEEAIVPLKEKRPVMIAYFTAWVDARGKLNFRNDIYGHDARLAREIFQMEGSNVLAAGDR
jgi:murein L,D-transpeptidase YcbB/YkuD